MQASKAGGRTSIPITSKYPRRASKARAALPVAVQTHSGIMETMTVSERTSSK